MSSSAERIDDFIASTRALTTEPLFLAEFPHPFLVREATSGGAPAPAGRADRSTLRVPKKAAAPSGDGFAREDVFIHRLRPRGDDPEQDAVTLGRDEACDVVVDEATVSLVHARFTLGEAAPTDDDDDGRRFFVADAGSSNGTFVDGAAIGEAPVLVADQVSLRFGPQAKFQFFTAASFFQFLDFYRRIKR